MILTCSCGNHRGRTFCCFVEIISGRPLPFSTMILQVGVYPGDTGFLDSPGKGREETVRLPLQRVLAPDCFVRVARPEIEDSYCALGDSDFGDESAVLSANWFMKW